MSALADPDRTHIDASRAFAQWIDRAVVVWNPPVGGAYQYALEYEPGHDGGGSIPLTANAAGLPARLCVRYPHLASLPAFTVATIDLATLAEALRSPLTASARDEQGRLLAATGVQIPGVLDDVYGAAAAGERLGPTWQGGRPCLKVWAPTARSVAVKLYDCASGGSHRLVSMQCDAATGIWSTTGDADWMGRYYTYAVTVYAPSVQTVVTNEVTDPYSVSLSADSIRSQLVDLADPALAPSGWQTLPTPRTVRPQEATIYELHIRDFSASDPTVPQPLRGTYAAFTMTDSTGMRALRELAQDGLTHVQLMPAFDFATAPDRRMQQMAPAVDLASLPPDSDLQQDYVTAFKDRDGYNWGYDPLHRTVPEGSYATDPDGRRRIREFRAMVAALNDAGLRVVMDVVYNHSYASGQHPRSVLDRIVPGYYLRLREDGTVSTATGCLDTAPEHLMMGKLVVDSVLTWAEQYKIGGFRFDLMGFHPKENMLAVRAALDKLTPVDGPAILLYGEGWNFGDIGNDTRFVQATQRNMAGTGIGTFNDLLRDAVRGGSPLDADPRSQGFGSGLYTAPNGASVNGSQEDQRARLLWYQRLIEVGLTGNLRSYRFRTAQGTVAAPEQAYNAEPGEALTYVDAHDNETLFDALTHKLPRDTPMADRVRMHSLSLAIVLLAQGPALVLAGTDRLRSKSLDRNSYNSGDWFNRLLWDCRNGNGFAAGLPPAADNQPFWTYDRPLLADPALRPDCTAIEPAQRQFREFLRVRGSSPAFSLGTAAEAHRRISFRTPETPGVIVMRIDVTGLDPRWRALTVVFNATPGTHVEPIDPPPQGRLALHPVQAASLDPVVTQSTYDNSRQTLTVPARTVAVFVEGP
jgi:pullulanase